MKNQENSVIVNGIVLTEAMQKHLKGMQQEGLASVLVEYCEKMVDHFLDEAFFDTDEHKLTAYNHIIELRYMKGILQDFDIDTTDEEGGNR